MQQTIAFCHDKDFEMLKLGCTKPNPANICLHKSTDAEFYPFREGDKDLWKKFGKLLLVVHLSFLHAKQLSMKLLFEGLQTYAKLLLGLMPANYIPTRSVNCQPMPTGLHTRWEFDSETSRFKPRQNKTRSFENLVMSYFQRTKPECEIEGFFAKGRQKKNDCFNIDGFCFHCNTVLEAMVCFYHFCPCQELLSLKWIFNGIARRELDALREHYMQEKGFNVIEMRECGW